MEDFDRLKAQKDAYMKAERPHRMSYDATQAAAELDTAILRELILAEIFVEKKGKTCRLIYNTETIDKVLYQALAQAKADGLREAGRIARAHVTTAAPQVVWECRMDSIVEKCERRAEQIEARAREGG